MCLLVLAWNAHPRYRLVVAANRDEFHDRPALPLAQWTDRPEILAGRDVRAGGAWIGIDRERRFGVVTNFRDLQRRLPGTQSRGDLIPSYFGQPAGAGDVMTQLAATAPHYSGFNLLLADARTLWYGSNRADSFARELSTGIHGLSNHFLDTPWPKLQRVRRRFDVVIEEQQTIDPTRLFSILADRHQVMAGAELPQTGVAPEWERVLSAPFVLNPNYGTRCSTVVLLEHSGAVYIGERRFDPAGEMSGETELRLNAAEWPETPRNPHAPSPL